PECPCPVCFPALSMLLCPTGSLGLQFVQDPGNVTSSLGKPVSLRCELQGEGVQDPPDIVWQRDGTPLDLADTNQMHMSMNEDSWLAVSMLRFVVHQALNQCKLYTVALLDRHTDTVNWADICSVSLRQLAVKPSTETPHSSHTVSVLRPGSWPFRLGYSEAIVKVSLTRALLFSISLSAGINKTSSFSCEAHNRKGVATSASGTVTVIPAQPQKLQQVSASNSSMEISWETGFGGVYPVDVCSIQAAPSESDLIAAPRHLIHNQNVNVPPARHAIGGLSPFMAYRVRVACRSSQGASPWTDWVTLRTAQGVPDAAPVVSVVTVNSSEVRVSWNALQGRINGELQGYRLEYSSPSTEPAVQDAGLSTELSLNLSIPQSNLSFRVCAYTGAGAGPWSPPYTLTLTHPELSGLSSRGKNPGEEFSWHWWYVVMAISVAIALAILIALYVARLRRKETRFGEAFEPMMESGELVVRYRARRSYSRRTTEATLNSLGISDELKQKLQDVMVDRHKLTLGKTLGEGEFGSVMEGLLSQEEFVLKVAVKTMKIAICTRSEMEDFLREAACMKEFDHPNVMRLIGVCLQTVESEGYPSPVVILPFMKHGDLHSYLLYSRLGDCPVYLPSQMLVKFMTDIARGMEYLSSKNFIHRDLAARNCMLNENMTVCVADFGLSKKIYNGDYYRQGRISKMPVKWIAIESLADRVYTTKSDVWSFGVTMWEIATRGQTPYPGVENSEIYDYLRQGNRLKQPPDCLDSIYALMFSCWLLSPKDRPGFESLRCQLEKTLEELPDPQGPEDILYVNMEEPGSELGAVGGREPLGSDAFLKTPPPPFSLSPLKGAAPVAVAEVHQPGRYVLCPQHENQRLLSESLESLPLTMASPSLTLGPEEWEEGPQAVSKDVPCQ
uniref:receptor protein-tyrosine kinase n=1 Tax=Lepisosteus oculatus TaxID=7918 RepID=W5N9Z8_LEPOC